MSPQHPTTPADSSGRAAEGFQRLSDLARRVLRADGTFICIGRPPHGEWLCTPAGNADVERAAAVLCQQVYVRGCAVSPESFPPPDPYSSFLCVPVESSAGAVTGAVGVLCGEAHAWTRTDHEIAADIAACVAAHIDDIAERRATAAELAEKEEQFRQITEHVRELFWIFTADFSETIYVSPTYERLWGGSLERLYAETRSFVEVVHPDDRAIMLDGMRRVAEGPIEELEYRIIMPDGDIRWMVSRGAPVRDENGVAYRVVGTTEDITDRKALEAERLAAESHYRRLVQNAPYAVYVLDAQARFTELNPAAVKLVGRPAEEMIGRSIAEIVLPEDLPKALASIQDKVAGDVEVSDIELRMIHSSGAIRLTKIRATAIMENGVYVGTHGIAADITEERAREQEMRLLAAALHNLDDGIAVARPDGQMLYANAKYAELLGFDVRERPLPLLRDFTAPEYEQGAQQALQSAVEEGSWTGRINYRLRPDGRVIPMSIILGRVEAEGELLLFILLRDISRDIEKEEHLRRAERLASVGTLVGGVAHELNNPLNAITSFATLLLETPRPAEEREDIATIHREALRAAKIVSDLRLLARRTQDEAQRHVEVDLNDVVLHVLRTRRYAHETGNISTTLELAAELPPIRADRGQVEQVVINLVVNAEQAMERTEGERRLVVRTRNGGTVALQVIDSGAGIPPADIDRIFDPFFTTKPTGEGTGLGLSLVHSIVVEHGGRVNVESEPGRSTTFQVEFPPFKPEAPSSVSTAVAGQPRRSLRILVVDDEPAIRRALVRYLGRRGHTAEEAGDGAEALRLLAAADIAAPFDVILSDLRMPGMSGDRLLQRLRDEGTGMHRRVIFLTGDAASGRASDMLGPIDAPVIYKPVELAELAERIEAWAEQA